MPRFTHVASGVVVDVDDATAETLGGDWAPVKDAEKPARRKAPSKSE
jgi:hypothetical protein